MADEPDEMTAEQFKSMIGAHIGKLTGLGHEIILEMGGIKKDLMRAAAALPDWRSFAEDVGDHALASAEEIAEVITKLAEYTQRRDEADRGDSTGGPA